MAQKLSRQRHNSNIIIISLIINISRRCFCHHFSHFGVRHLSLTAQTAAAAAAAGGAGFVPRAAVCARLPLPLARPFHRLQVTAGENSKGLSPVV
jgi:hypothetical protein